MKRHLTFELKSIHPDYKTPMPKALEKRIGKAFKLIGDIKVGNKLTMYFEDGYIFKTESLDIHGYVNEYDDNDEVVFVTLCTKNMAFEMDVVKKKINVKIEEQLTMA